MGSLPGEPPLHPVALALHRMVEGRPAPSVILSAAKNLQFSLKPNNCTPFVALRVTIAEARGADLEVGLQDVRQPTDATSRFADIKRRWPRHPPATLWAAVGLRSIGL